MRKTLTLGTALTLALSLLIPTALANAADLRTCAQGGQCVIGDTGPGGGVVFFVKSTGAFSASQSLSRLDDMSMLPILDTVSVSLTLEEQNALPFEYLEVAPIAGVGNTRWANDIAWSTTSLPPMSKKIGSGLAGTATIVNAYPTQTSSNNAAHYANGYANNGLTDWFLPSMDELALITIRHVAGALGAADPVQALRTGPSNFYGWSTTDVETGSVVRMDSLWSKDYNVSSGSLSVLPIRAFSEQEPAASTAPPSEFYGNLMPEKSIIKKVSFRFGSLVLRDSRKAALDKLFLEAGANASYRITAGARDLPGTSATEEKALAMQRAKLAKAYLVKIGAKKTSFTLKTKIYSKSVMPKTNVLARFIIK